MSTKKLIYRKVLTMMGRTPSGRQGQSLSITQAPVHKQPVSREGVLSDSDGIRTALHFAALGGNEDCARVLVEWGMNLFGKDSDGHTPIDLCLSPVLAQHLERLGLKNDAFLSVGHNAETDDFVRRLVDHLKRNQLVSWWDKEERRGIRPGTKWNDSIEQAMRHSKTCVIILTKKWLESEFCNAEAKLASNLSKPLLCILPPVSDKQKATITDIPLDHPMKGILDQRQGFLLFQNLDLEDTAAFENCVKDLAVTIKSCVPNSNREKGPEWENARKQALSEIKQPRQNVPLFSNLSHDSYVVVTTGARAPEMDSVGKMFVEVLASQLVESGVPCAIAYTNAGSSHDYVERLTRLIERASLMIVVLEEGSDMEHIGNVLTKTQNAKVKCMIVPYTKLSLDPSGVPYMTNYVSEYTCAFTDWGGTGEGFTEHSFAFKEIFENNFMHVLKQSLDTSRA